METTETAVTGMGLIEAERRRQIEGENYTAEHDQQHGIHALLRGAAAYETYHPQFHRGNIPSAWPWNPSTWKPKDRLSNLIRAGALYLAAVDLMVEQSGVDEFISEVVVPLAVEIDVLLARARELL